ncbi:Hsp70 family protein [Photobacterium leiognathi]|uniref:Hsp70 family protein n=1 Tax=Photobacterium leiognathi TaxID=553611 RepID=UPI0027366EBC|nr:Hsp70 family protein [Photobacterium leiognathi]
MKRTTIDYGIDLGTTNSAIARVDSGVTKIIKSKDTQKDTTSSAVAFNKKGSLIIGESAYTAKLLECKRCVSGKN